MPVESPASPRLLADTTPAQSIVGAIARHAATSPDRPAVSDGESTLTYAELDARADRLADRLLALGTQPGDCVALWFERSVDFVVAALAVFKAGAAYLPLDSGTPPDRASAILGDARVSALATHRGKARGLTPGGWPTIDLDDDAEADGVAASSNVEASPDDLAYVIYTSGSTGRPKGVEVTHGNLANLIAWHCSAFGVTEVDRGSVVAGFGFDAAVWEIWPYLASGAGLAIADEATRRSPQLLRDWLVAERVTVGFVPTLLAEQLLHAEWPADTALRFMLTGADTLHRRPSERLPFVLVNNYGPTECTVVATSGVVAPQTVREGTPSIGRAIDKTRILILDDALRAVPDGEAGELCIAGDGVARGYRHNPEQTAARFVAYPPDASDPVRIYRTGDRARRLADGEIAFLGRLDDQVKIRGNRVELGEIVAHLSLHPSIECATVLVRGAALAAYVVCRGETRPAASEIRSFLAACVPDYMVPDQFVALDGLPVSPNGKVDKAALPEPSPANLLAERPDVAPAPAEIGLAAKLSGIVAGLLNQPSVEPDANFFLLGGHSMLGVQLVSRIRDAFGVKLTLRQLFNSPTVHALSGEIARSVDAAAPRTRAS